MDREEAVAYLREKAEADPELDPLYATEAAWRWTEKQAPPYHIKQAANVQEVLEYARQLQADAGGGDEEPEQTFKPSPGAAILSRRLVEAMRPWVERTRRVVEERDGEVELPFPDRERAADWIERVCEEDRRQLTDDEEDQARELQKRIHRVIDEFSALTGASPEQPTVHKFLTLPYRRPDSATVLPEVVDADGRLAPLARELEQVAAATGFREVQLTTFVLAGVEPVLVPARARIRHEGGTLPDGTAIERTSAYIKIRSPEVTVDELRARYSWIREQWGAKESNRLTEKDRDLYELIRDLGGPWDGRAPHGTWTEVAERLGGQGWSWRKRWERMQERLERPATIQAPGEDG